MGRQWRALSRPLVWLPLFAAVPVTICSPAPDDIGRQLQSCTRQPSAASELEDADISFLCAALQGWLHGWALLLSRHCGRLVTLLLMWDSCPAPLAMHM